MGQIKALVLEWSVTGGRVFARCPSCSGDNGCDIPKFPYPPMNCGHCGAELQLPLAAHGLIAEANGAGQTAELAKLVVDGRAREGFLEKELAAAKRRRRVFYYQTEAVNNPYVEADTLILEKLGFEVVGPGNKDTREAMEQAWKRHDNPMWAIFRPMILESDAVVVRQGKTLTDLMPMIRKCAAEFGKPVFEFAREAEAGEPFRFTTTEDRR